MKKIPTLFIRDMTKQPALAIDQVTPGCEWALTEVAIPTRKWDGTCCLVRDGKFYGRREVRPGQVAPGDFELTEHDENTGKSFGWVPIDDGPEWKWHLVALKNRSDGDGHTPADGTYEACGPHFQKNPESFLEDILVPHGDSRLVDFYRQPGGVEPTYAGLQRALVDLNWEGIVFYHPDGRRAKIKLKDFGLRRK